MMNLINSYNTWFDGVFVYIFGVLPTSSDGFTILTIIMLICPILNYFVAKAKDYVDSNW